MKYKVGDRVRIVAKKDGQGWNPDGDMDKWLGKFMTIRDVSCGCYRMKEDGPSGWFWWEHMIEGLAENSKIVITTDGKTTTARLFNGKELIRKAEAKCSPDDEFDFMIGAKLAMERLEETVTVPEKKFTPHLECGKWYYGNIGEKTNIKDAIGRELKIGDTVDLYDGTRYFDESPIVFDEGKAFVMGIEMRCEPNGNITGSWQIIKKRGYGEVANGETVKGITYIKEEA